MTAPVIDNFSPPNGSTIEAADPIFFDVTDDSGLFTRVLPMLEQGGVTELVHNGDSFVEPYAAQSTRENIVDGFRYRVRRSGGWQSNVVSVIFAYDADGNEGLG